MNKKNMENIRVIEINPDQCLVVDDARVNIGDWCICLDETSDSYLKIVYNQDEHVRKNWFRITHATKPIEQYYSNVYGTIPYVYHKVKQITMEEIERIQNG